MASLSVIIPALNEEANLAAAVESVAAAAQARFQDYEILIFNDGSADRTGPIADELAKKNSHIRAIHNGRNRGFGYNYRRGAEMARCDYVVMIPGDNETDPRSVQELFSHVGKAEIILAFPDNPEVRTPSRQILSSVFTRLVNCLFGLQVRYYNGLNIIRKDILQKVPMTTDSFAYMAEILVYLVSAGARYQEAPFHNQARSRGASKAFKPSNLAKVLSLLVKLWWRIRILGVNPVKGANPPA